MASKVQKPCKICGKMFTPCADCESNKTMFRWKRVACSPKCAKEYFAKIEASRQPKVEIVDSQSIKADKNEVINTVSKNEEDRKPKRTRKKNIENEESEQIG